ncbi:hypothetical protein ACFLQP_01895 [Acidobacteriota bacterium]
MKNKIKLTLLGTALTIVVFTAALVISFPGTAYVETKKDNKIGEVVNLSSTAHLANRGWHPRPIHGQPDAALSGTSSQKFAEKTKFHKVLVKREHTCSGTTVNIQTWTWEAK